MWYFVFGAYIFVCLGLFFRKDLLWLLDSSTSEESNDVIIDSGEGQKITISGGEVSLDTSSLTKKRINVSFNGKNIILSISNEVNDSGYESIKSDAINEKNFLEFKDKEQKKKLEKLESPEPENLETEKIVEEEKENEVPDDNDNEKMDIDDNVDSKIMSIFNKII